MLFSKKEFVIIVGCGRLGSTLAGDLSYKGYDIAIIDKNKNVFEELPDNFSGYQINADGTDTGILENVGIKKATMLLAVTENDNINSMVAQIAKRIYNVPNVYMRLNNPDLEEIVKDDGIKVIYPFKLSVEEFERLSFIDVPSNDEG
jgi:trk system potassium uptake protein TrkA